MKTLKIGIICGGPSGERKISVKSANFVWNLLGKMGISANLLVMGKDRVFYSISGPDAFFHAAQRDENFLEKEEVSWGQVVSLSLDQVGKCWIQWENGEKVPMDLAFPILHGRGGEDGAIQGFLETLALPYVGCNIAASVLGMHKALARRILKGAGILVVPFQEFRRQGKHLLSWSEEGDWHLMDGAQPSFHEFSALMEKWKVPHLMVKPSSEGSSLGVEKVEDFKGLQDAIQEAFRYGDSVLVEPFLHAAQEVECGILQEPDGSLLVSGLGEVFLEKGDFYDYAAKYLDPLGERAKILHHARISPTDSKSFQKMAQNVFRLLGCSGLARVDGFFWNQKMYFSEINTMPGLTASSLYPVLIKQQGYSEEAWIQALIQNALEKHGMSGLG